MRMRKILFGGTGNFFFTKIINAFKYFLTRKNKLLKLKYLPLSMDIEPTTGCNFRCTMCQVSSPDFEARNMDLKTFKTVIDQNKQLIKIKLQGMGEPFVNKHLFKMIKYANSNGISVEFVTNGSLLNDENINKILKSEISRIVISIDGATKSTFENIRIKSNFEQVILNAKKLSKAIKENKYKTDFEAICLVQKNNFDEIEKISDLCNQIGFHTLHFQVQLTGWGKEDWEQVNYKKDINYSDLGIQDRFKKLKTEKSNSNFKIIVVEENLLNFNKQCSYPFENPYISSTGKIIPCCMIADENVINFGSIKEENFLSIWNSEKYQSFRKDIINNSLENYCKNCYEEFRTKS
jgi:pyrroloquinoline quinone biosynthesis protein E